MSSDTNGGIEDFATWLRSMPITSRANDDAEQGTKGLAVTNVQAT